MKTFKKQIHNPKVVDLNGRGSRNRTHDTRFWRRGFSTFATPSEIAQTLAILEVSQILVFSLKPFFCFYNSFTTVTNILLALILSYNFNFANSHTTHSYY